jgi:hypothetical protein
MKPQISGMFVLSKPDNEGRIVAKLTQQLTAVNV